MANSGELPCYVLINPKDFDQPSEHQLKLDIENGTTQQKTEALKRCIYMLIAGERLPGILMAAIRFLLPLQDHTIKKLLLIFWEIVPKRSADGKLLQEMILVCDAFRKDLQHANEYVRGSTLRYLCKLKEPELLEPLVPIILLCVEHRHSYVRRNAVLAVYSIYKDFPHLVPNAVQLMHALLCDEQNHAVKRNALITLIHCDQQVALDYISTHEDRLDTFGDVVQLVIVELIYKACSKTPSYTSRYVRCLYSLLASSSVAVRYEACTTLVHLSSNVSAIKAVASTYAKIILKSSDNNVKLIVLDRLIELRKYSEDYNKIIEPLILDILRILPISVLEVREKVLDLSLELVSARTIDEFVVILKKELMKIQSTSKQDDSARYCQLLVRACHSCCTKFPAVTPHILPVITTTLTSADTLHSALTDVISLLRDVMYHEQTYRVRHTVITALISVYTSVAAVSLAPGAAPSGVLRSVTWLLGEFITELEDFRLFVDTVRSALGPLPLAGECSEPDAAKLETDTAAGLHSESGTEQTKQQPHTTAPSGENKLITADGTYASQSVFSTTPHTDSSSRWAETHPLRTHLVTASDMFLGATLACALTKLVLRCSATATTAVCDTRRLCVECLLIVTSVLRVALTNQCDSGATEGKQTANADDIYRLNVCLSVLSELQDPEGTWRADGASSAEFLEQVIVASASQALSMMLQNEREVSAAKQKEADAQQWLRTGHRQQTQHCHVDTGVQFELLNSARQGLSGGDTARRAGEGGVQGDLFDVTLKRALGDVTTLDGQSATDIKASKLNKVVQLSGFSDPVYCEAYVKASQYDIVLDVLLVNQTSDTLQNCCLEFSTLGDLRLVEKPHSLVLAPHDFASTKASLKVTSTSNSAIFGYMVYDLVGAASDRSLIVLNDIHIDIMDYIVPSICSEQHFRKMWAEFEWENKVTVNTSIKDLKEYLFHLLKCTNMKCLTAEKSLTFDSGFLAANLYAKSIFGEDALANLSIEKQRGKSDAPVIGHIRIRSKTQGMALSFGDRISNIQKTSKSSEQTGHLINTAA